MTHINWNDPNPLFINPEFGIDLQGKAPKGIPLPTYGNYGGPNISGPGKPVDALDALFQAHDKTIQNAMSDSKTPSVLTPDELVAAHAKLFYGINNLPKSHGLILDDAGATLYAGFTIFGLTAQLAQLGLLEKLEVALVNFSDPKAPFDLFDPSGHFDDVLAALNDARGYMESGLAGLTPEEEGEARSLNGLLSIFENQFDDYFMA